MNAAGMFNMMYVVVVAFILTYVLIIKWYNKKTYFVWATILLLFVLQVMSPIEALKAINWNVIGIYVAMLFIAEAFIYSRIPEYLSQKIIQKSGRTWIAMLGICLLSGIISIVVENVAVVLIIAPIALVVSEKLDINPIPLLIGIAIMSNLQGVATMIGDPPSLLLANYAKMDFNDFFFFEGRPSLFFAVQIGVLASMPVLYWVFRQHNQQTISIEPYTILSLFPGVILAVMIFFLAISSFYNYSGETAWVALLDANKVGLICMACGMVIWIWYYFQEKDDFFPMLGRLDWDTGIFLCGIFVLVESLIKVGFIDFFAQFVASQIGNDLLLAYLVIIVSSVAFSAFVDNVPFIAAMLPLVGNLSGIMGVPPHLLYFGLVLGASVGGNVTPVGASANIVAMGILKKNGTEPTFMQFVRIGLPFTIISVLASTAFIKMIFT